MPMPKNADDILYTGIDGRELDERAERFADSCIKALKDIGIYNDLKNKTILDVGCGIGYLLKKLPGKTTGVEPNSIAYKNKLSGTNIINGYMKDVKDKYNLVMAWHVIEHVDNPYQFILDMKNHIYEKGHILIATPNNDSWFARSKTWRCLEPFHKYLLGKSQLEEMLQDAGFKIVKTLTWGGYPYPRTWWQQIINQVAKKIGRGDVQLVYAEKV